MRSLLSVAARTLPVLLPLIVLSGCAHDPEDLAVNDPAAPTNRTLFAGNMAVDHHVLRPVARLYVDDVPAGARHGVHHFVSNLGEPMIFVNDVLQGNASRSWNTVQRFAINSTVGVVGIFDIAQGWGLPSHKADFGQTLGVWGVGAGPDVQLPLLGFSNLRDLAGKGVEFAANPTNLITGPVVAIVSGAGTGLGVVDGRADTLAITDDVERTSLDEYATLRSITAQHRAAFIQEGKAGRVRPVAVPGPGQQQAAVVAARPS